MQIKKIPSLNNPFLLTPGPTHIPDLIFQSMHRNIHHRTQEFQQIFSFCRSELSNYFSNPNQPLLFTGSGTSLMEISLLNTISPNDKVISLSFGKFSERFSEIATHLDCEVIDISSPYGTYPLPEQLANTLAKHPDTKAVISCHSETSTGVLAPIHEYAQIIKSYPAIFIVDCISSLGAIPINQQENHIDLCFGVGNKGFMTPPGLGFISYYGEKIISAFQNSRSPKFHTDLQKEIKAQEENNVRCTPNIHAILGLEQGLKILSNQSITEIFTQRQELASYTRSHLLELGFNSFVQEPYTQSDSVLVFSCENSSSLIQKIAHHGFVIANGQGSLADKVFRIGNLGVVDLEIMQQFIDILKKL